MMLELIYLVIKIYLLANLLVNFSPLHWLIEVLPDNLFKWVITVLTSCMKCASFWISMIMTGGDLILSAGVYLVVGTIWRLQKIINDKWLVKLERP